MIIGSSSSKRTERAPAVRSLLGSVVLVLGRRDERAASHLGADVEAVGLLRGTPTTAGKPDDTNRDVADGHGTDDNAEGDEDVLGDAGGRDGGRRVVGERAEDVAGLLAVAARVVRGRGRVHLGLGRGPGRGRARAERVVRVPLLALSRLLALTLDAAAVETLLATESDVVWDLYRWV